MGYIAILSIRLAMDIFFSLALSMQQSWKTLLVGVPGKFLGFFCIFCKFLKCHVGKTFFVAVTMRVYIIDSVN